MIEDVHTCTQQFFSWVSTLKTSCTCAVGDVYKNVRSNTIGISKINKKSKLGKKSQYPSTPDCINKSQCGHTVEHRVTMEMIKLQL